MATTSGNLTADKAITGQNGNGKGSKGRAAAMVATAALGLSILIGGAIGQGRQAAQQAAPPAPSAVEDRRGGLPANVSMSEEFRWDFGAPQAALPADASTSTEFRWGFREAARPLVPEGASTSADFRWDFGGAGAVRPADASTTTEYRWDFGGDR